MPDPTPVSPSPSRGFNAVATPGSALATLQVGLLLVAVLYFGQELLVPLVLAVLLSFVLAPLVRLLRKIAVPRVVAVLVTVALACTIIFGIAGLMGRQATVLAENLPGYQATISQKLAGLKSMGGLLERLTGTVQAVGRGMNGEEASPRRPGTLVRDPTGAPVPVEIRTPDPTSFELLRQLAEPLLEPLATAGIVIILVIFILLYREDLRDRLIRLIGARDLHRTMAAMDDAAYRLSRFFLVQTGMNTAYGLFIAGALWLIGIPNWLLWGFVAGLMRFVPFIGGFIAAGFPALLALAVDPGWATLVWVVVLFGISEAVMGQVFEPLVFGHSTGLSPVAVIAAATFWTWLWGPIGLLLAVPLTVCLVVLGRHVDRLEFLEVMLGDRPPLDPDEAFYQRALAGDANALAEQAERGLKEKPLAEYLDAVALPALRMAQADIIHGVLQPDRRETLQHSLDFLMEDLEEADDPRPPKDKGQEEPSPLPPEWHAPGAVLCLPGRGPFDEVAAQMLGQVLTRHGFGVQVSGIDALPGEPPRLVCLCLLEGGSSSASARYLLRRARRRLPGVPAMALAWSPEPDGALVTALRTEGATAPLQLATNVAEALDLALEGAGLAPASAQARPAPQQPEAPSLGMASAPAPA